MAARGAGNGETVLIKAYHADECRRISFEQSTMSYEWLCDQMKSLFGLDEPVRLYYMDEVAMERIPTLAKGTDILAAAREMAKTGRTLKVKVVLAEDGSPPSLSSSLMSSMSSLSYVHVPLSPFAYGADWHSPHNGPVRQIGMERTEADSAAPSGLSQQNNRPSANEACGVGQSTPVSVHEEPMAMGLSTVVQDGPTDAREDGMATPPNRMTPRAASMYVTPNNMATKDGDGALLANEALSGRENGGAAATRTTAGMEGAVPPTSVAATDGRTAILANETTARNEDTVSAANLTADHNASSQPAWGQDPASHWREHVINEGQYHRLIVQTRLEQEWAQLATDLRCLAVVTEVQDRLRASAQFTEEQTALVCRVVHTALARLAEARRGGDKSGGATVTASEEGKTGAPPPPLAEVVPRGQVQQHMPPSPALDPITLPPAVAPPTGQDGEVLLATQSAASGDPSNEMAAPGQSTSEDCMPPTPTEMELVRYANELRMLAEMGFTDDCALYVRLLKETENVGVVVNRLLEGST